MMNSKKIKEQIKIEEKLIDDFVETFKLDQKKAGDIIKDKNNKEYTFEGSGIFNLTDGEDDKDFINQIIDNGIMDKEIAYKDGKYTYIINVHPYINIKDEDE